MIKVLIVEDDTNIREILEDFFKTNLHIETVLLAQDGLDAYNLCCQVKFDIICTDHSMPFLTGLDFCNAVRKAEVQGEIVNDRYKVTYFKLLKSPEKKESPATQKN